MPVVSTPGPVRTEPTKSNRGRWFVFGLVGFFAVIGMAALGYWFATKSTITTVQTPSVVGKSVSDANTTLTEAKLKLGLQTPQNDDKAPIGTILSQDPAAGTSIKEGESVNVVVSAGIEKATVPDLSSVTTQDAANKALGDAKLKLGIITQEDSDSLADLKPAGTVLSQSPAPNTSVDVNSSVDVTISSGKIKVPNVVNKTKTQANNDLINAGFNVSFIYEERSDKSDGIVLAQTPASGKGLAQGGNVTLTISRYVPEPTPTSSKTGTPLPSPSAT